MILITHAHFDHIGGANSLRKECSVKIAIGKKDNPALSDNVLNEGINFGYDIEPFSADLLLRFEVGAILFYHFLPYLSIAEKYYF